VLGQGAALVTIGPSGAATGIRASITAAVDRVGEQEASSVARMAFVAVSAMIGRVEVPVFAELPWRALRVRRALTAHVTKPVHAVAGDACVAESALVARVVREVAATKLAVASASSSRALRVSVTLVAH
jgi:hypothetical protein